MIQYEKINGSETRQVQSKTKAIFLPVHLLCPFDLASLEALEWQAEHDHLCNLAVNAEDKPQAQDLAIRLQKFLEKDRHHPKAKKILDRLMKMKAKPIDDYSAFDTWEAGAFALSRYCEESIVEIVKSRLSLYEGSVLEVFCGHNSYFESSQSRQITALDGCKKSLLRYTHSDAERFCCDLDQLADGMKLDFLSESSFDLVSVCFGYKYPRAIEPIMREFFRLLKPGGIVFFVESKTHGYNKYINRVFEGPQVITQELTSVGFEHVLATEISVERIRGSASTRFDTGVFHVIALRP